MDSKQIIQQKHQSYISIQKNIIYHSEDHQLNDYAIYQSKLERKIKQLNALAAHYINQDQYNQAITYLKQAQKILQHVTKYGKSIDKILTITTLHNTACAYQKLNQLQRSSTYMEQLIANIEPNLDNAYCNQINENTLDQKSKSYKDLNFMFNIQIQGIFYYLQYSAICSQINHHNLSYQTARSSLKILQDLCKDCLRYQKAKKGKNSLLLQKLTLFIKLKQQIMKDVLIQTKSALNQIKRHRHFFSFDSKIIQNFMIGQVMQMNPTTIEQKQKNKKLQDHISHLGLIYKVFYLSICYFVMSTELRLISNRNSQSEMQKPKLYHLYSIKIVATLVPCQSKFLTHLIQSFKNHYKIDLTTDNYLLLEQIQPIDLKQNKTSKKSKKKIKIKFNNFQSQDQNRLTKTPNKLKTSPIRRAQKIRNQNTVRNRLFDNLNNDQQEEEQNCYAFPKKTYKGGKTYNKQKDSQKKSAKKEHHITLQQILHSRSLRKNKKEKSTKEYLYPDNTTIKKKNNSKMNRKIIHRSKSKQSKLSLDTQKPKV